MIRAVARIAVWWCFWHAQPAPADAPGWDGRIITRPCAHLGMRPATDGSGVAVTAQYTFCSPF